MPGSTRILLLSIIAILFSCAGAQYSELDPPQRYLCQNTTETLTIDGRLNEPGWIQAKPSTPFVDIVSGEPAWLDCTVKMLWDEKNLYLGYTVEEPHVQADLTERDSKIWMENDVEFFIAGQNAYYELELNARNTVYEVFWIWKDSYQRGSPYYGLPEFNPESNRVMTLSGVGGHIHPRGERWGFLDWDYPGLLTAVDVQGTLNDSSDLDQGWTVEVALRWEGLKLLSDGRALPPKNGDEWRIDCSRFQSLDLEGNALERSAGWTWNRHGHYDSHIPERFTTVVFIDPTIKDQRSKIEDRD